MENESQNQSVTKEECLQEEIHGEIKHEYINDYIYAMTGASRHHNRISRNVLAVLILN